MTRKTRVPHILKSFAALCFTALLLCSLSIPALAAVPDRPQNQYVLDEAGVLDSATEREIISKNQKLFEKTGAEIVIVAVDFLGGQEIDDYVFELFNSWGVGSEQRNNGILLVMAIGEDNYYAQAGYGIEDYFDSRLQSLLDEYLEPDFAARDYDVGAKKFFDAVYTELETYSYDDSYDDQEYGQGGANTDNYDYEYESGYRASDFVFTVLRFVFRIVLVIIVIVVILAVIRALSGGGGGPGNPGGGGGGGGFWRGMFWGNMLGSRRRRGWYAPPPPPPPGGFGPGPRPPRNGGGFGGFGGFSGGGRSGGFGGSRGGFSGGGRSGGFSRGGGSRGGGAGRR